MIFAIFPLLIALGGFSYGMVRIKERKLYTKPFFIPLCLVLLLVSSFLIYWGFYWEPAKTVLFGFLIPVAVQNLLLAYLFKLVFRLMTTICKKNWQYSEQDIYITALCCASVPFMVYSVLILQINPG